MGEMPAGRVAKELISVLGTVAAVSTGAYLVTRPRPPLAPDPGAAGRIRELERRLAALERAGAAAPPPALPTVAARRPAAALPTDSAAPPPALPTVASVGVVAPVAAPALPPIAAAPVLPTVRPVGPVGPVGQMHKPFTVTHYENLASQVAHERQIAELERRLAAIEATRVAGSLGSQAVRRSSGTANRNGPAGHRERRRG
jgi:hypothetical protein